MDDVRFGDLWAETVDAIRSDLGHCAAFAAGLIVVGMASDLMLPASVAAGTIASLIVTLFGQSHLIRRYLERKDMARASSLVQGRYATIFGISLLTGLGIFAGIILLVLPGLFLAARWFVSVPAMFAEDGHITESISSSWHMTQPHYLPIIALILLIFTPVFAVIIFTLLATNPDLAITPLESFIVNVAIAITTVAGWMASVSTYRIIKGGAPNATEIFG